MNLMQRVWTEDKCQNLVSPAIQQNARLLMLAVILVIVVGTVHLIGSTLTLCSRKLPELFSNSGIGSMSPILTTSAPSQANPGNRKRTPRNRHEECPCAIVVLSSCAPSPTARGITRNIYESGGRKEWVGSLSGN